MAEELKGQVFPAPAGMNRDQQGTGIIQGGVPRACGDEPSL